MNQKYGTRIYNLNYEKLTMHQKIETKKLIDYLDLNWEHGCLNPEKNNRTVLGLTNTSSQKNILWKLRTLGKI